MISMRTLLPPLGLAFAVFLVSVCSAMARPATTKDLAGRKICWDNGETSIYVSGGKWENSSHGAWRVTPAGLEIHSETFDGILSVEIQDDGTILDATYNIAGKFCK